MRFILPIILSLFITLGLFFGMQIMTSSDNQNLKKDSQTHQLVYLREKKDTNIERKKRLPKKKEVKKKIKKFKVVKKFNTKQPKQVKIQPIKIQRNIEFSKIASLNGAQVLLDANSLNPLKKRDPIYPRRAKIKRQEGFVKLLFDIGTQGFARNIRVLESTPADVFEQACITAIKKWRFRNKDVSQSATITFNFRLAK